MFVEPCKETYLYVIKYQSRFETMECLKEVRKCVSGPGGLKLSIFVVQKLALHQKGVEFRQQSIGAIGFSLLTS